MKRLGINIDHIATIRNARGENHPNILNAAKHVMKYGADLITVHLREDSRHIKKKDLIDLSKISSAPINLEMRLSVQDSPNSAGVVIDAIRCAALAKERRLAGPLNSASSYYMKTPPVQHRDHIARELTNEFIMGKNWDKNLSPFRNSLVIVS